MAVMSAQDGAILKGAEATRDARTEMAKRIQVVAGHVESLGAGFQGQAAAAFNKLMMDWNTESSQVTQALEGFEENLRGHQANLDQGEQNQSASFSKIASRLGGN